MYMISLMPLDYMITLILFDVHEWNHWIHLFRWLCHHRYNQMYMVPLVPFSSYDILSLTIGCLCHLSSQNLSDAYELWYHLVPSDVYGCSITAIIRCLCYHIDQQMRMSTSDGHVAILRMTVSEVESVCVCCADNEVTCWSIVRWEWAGRPLQWVLRVLLAYIRFLNDICVRSVDCGYCICMLCSGMTVIGNSP